jgi:hypothetical protein
MSRGFEPLHALLPLPRRRNTFEREEWSIKAEGVTHLQLVIKPDKDGKHSQATLTTLAVR